MKAKVGLIQMQVLSSSLDKYRYEAGTPGVMVVCCTQRWNNVHYSTTMNKFNLNKFSIITRICFPLTSIFDQ
jgi:hypothetical protein